jgi:DNA-binding CsgD family transcriptional regulator
MTLHLSADDVARFEAALTTVLSPLAYERRDDWRLDVMRTCQSLLGADQSVFAIVRPGEAVVRTADTRTERAASDYQDYFWRTDSGVMERRRSLGLSVYHRDMVYDRSQLPRSELYVDWCKPHRLYDALAMSADAVDPGAPLAPTLGFYHEREGSPPFGERGLSLLRMLLPAFNAGALMWLRDLGHTQRVLGLLDSLSHAAAVFDARGESLHRNAGLRSLLDTEPQRARIEAAAARMVAAIVRLTRPHGRSTQSVQPVPATSEVTTDSARYRLDTSLMGAPGTPELIILLVERQAPRVFSDHELRALYGLTPRECGVVRLLASAATDMQIAHKLGISWHTARRHTERVLLKLSVHTRSEVAAKLQAAR